jgi:hypothetical protein
LPDGSGCQGIKLTNNSTSSHTAHVAPLYARDSGPESVFTRTGGNFGPGATDVDAGTTSGVLFPAFFGLNAGSLDNVFQALVSNGSSALPNFMTGIVGDVNSDTALSNGLIPCVDIGGVSGG